MMRRVLVEHAREHGRVKRGSGKVALEDCMLVSPQPDRMVVELDDALDRLAEVDPRRAELIELTYFGAPPGAWPGSMRSTKRKPL